MTITILQLLVAAAGLWIGLEIDPGRHWSAYVFLIGGPAIAIGWAVWIRRRARIESVEYKEK
jgi:hypothetical protein